MNILFISHSAGQTGAPMLLLNLLRWYQNNTPHAIHILLRGDGPLREQFGRIGPTQVFSEIEATGIDPTQQLTDLYGHIDLIYSNTGTNGRILYLLAGLDRPVVTHLHEMRYALAMWGEGAFDHVLARTSRWICVSRPVQEQLVVDHGVDPRRTLIIPACIHLPPEVPPPHDHRMAILRKLGLTDPVRMVMGAGTFDWRKGADLFIQVAARVVRQDGADDVHFVWLGDDGLDDAARLRVQIETAGLGISTNIHLLPFQEDILAFMAQCDLFVLPSREDPCPLVALEAASLGKALVCFEGGGGIVDLIRQGAGSAVAFMDIPAMATEILRLLDSPEPRRTYGLQGARLIQANHDLSRNAAQINHLVEQTHARRLTRRPTTMPEDV